MGLPFFKILFVTLLFSGIVCTSFGQSKEQLKAKPKFKVEISIEGESDSGYYLVTTVHVYDDAYFASPLSEDNFHSKLNIEIVKNDQLILENQYVENPESVAELDSVINHQVRWIRNSTTFQQKLDVRTSKDIFVDGQVFILEEPSCIPYQVHFAITRKGKRWTILQDKAIKLF